MNIDYTRNKEIDQSLKIGAKAFAVGAVLILVLSLTGMPNSMSGDPLLGNSMTHAVMGSDVDRAEVGDHTNAGAGDASATNAHIDVPFTTNQGDVEELPAQF